MNRNLLTVKNICFIALTLIIPLSCLNNDEQEIEYGNNKLAGKYVKVNNIKMYYETYGSGPPLILIHGNMGGIGEMGYQIPYFADQYRIIAADSREHGKSSGDGRRLTYEEMASDWAALLDRLEISSANIIGWSDGGIIGLLLAINYPEKVKKLAICGTNLQPDSTAVNNWALDWLNDALKKVDENIKKNDTTQNWQLLSKYYDLLVNQPNIPLEDLHKIKAPTLVMAGDRDIIREEHTVSIYRNIPNSRLCIFPSSTHQIPVEDSDLFNYVVSRFFDEPYIDEEDAVEFLDEENFLNEK